jgi:hypothetical protein
MAMGHIPGEDLELHALDRLAAAAPVEERLPVREERRQRLAEWDEYVGRCGRRWPSPP